MKRFWMLLAILSPCVAMGQFGVYAYVPSRNGFLALRGVHVESTVIGPIVRTTTDLTYANPVPSANEVSFNFELPQSSTLGGFGVFEGDQFLSGRLQLKGYSAKVNSEIGPGIREVAIQYRSSPSVYRCDIFPLFQGADVRVRLWAVEMLQPSDRQIVLPKPSVEIPVHAGSANWRAHRVVGDPLKVWRGDYLVTSSMSITAVAQKFSDGRYYIAGYIDAKNPKLPSMEILHASYESTKGVSGGKDVTAKVSHMVRNGQFLIWANNAVFGDSFVNAPKQLRVLVRIDGEEREITVSENERLNLLALGRDRDLPHIRGLRDVRVVFQDAGMITFFGWAPNRHRLTVDFQGHRYTTQPVVVAQGADAARLWAQQMLATDSIKDGDRVLAFSLKFGVLSNLSAFQAIAKASKPKGLTQRDVEMMRGGY